jgi:hypothetical protein
MVSEKGVFQNKASRRNALVVYCERRSFGSTIIVVE